MPTPNIALYQRSYLQEELEGMMHGTTLNQVTNIEGCFNRAARRVLADVDPQETKIVSEFGKVYDGVWDYPLTVDVKGNKIIDLFPQANRTPRDNFGQVYNKDFDLWKSFSLVPDFTPRYAGAVRTIRINATNLLTGILLNAADGYNTNGTWTAVQNVSDVDTNNQYMTDGAAGAVSFSLDQTGIPASVAIIRNTTMGEIDLSNHFNNADEFFNFYVPDVAGMTSIRYLFGTDTNNYYDSGALTTDQLGNTFGNGWNFMKEGWSSFTTVGAPDPSSISYIEIQITYDGTLQTNFLLNQFWSRLGRIFMQEYYSKYMFRDASTGTFKEKTDDENDYINLDTDGVNLMLFATFGEIVQQVQGADALYFDANQAEQRYQTELANYRARYRSEVIKPRSYYYKQPKSGYRRFFGGSRTS